MGVKERWRRDSGAGPAAVSILGTLGIALICPPLALVAAPVLFAAGKIRQKRDMDELEGNEPEETAAEWETARPEDRNFELSASINAGLLGTSMTRTYRFKRTQ